MLVVNWLDLVAHSVTQANSSRRGWTAGRFFIVRDTSPAVLTPVRGAHLSTAFSVAWAVSTRASIHAFDFRSSPPPHEKNLASDGVVRMTFNDPGGESRTDICAAPCGSCVGNPCLRRARAGRGTSSSPTAAPVGLDRVFIALAGNGAGQGCELVPRAFGPA